MTVSEDEPLDVHLSAAEREHLRLLVADWGLLADLCFSDLVLYVPMGDGTSPAFLVAGHVRPATSQTIYHEEIVGQVRSPEQRPLVAHAFLHGEPAVAAVDSVLAGERVSVQALPVRYRDRVIAVLAIEEAVSSRREPGQLESTYRRVFDRFAAMIQIGTFPYGVGDEPLPDAPRVGDGVLVADALGTVEYASPNATSALTRAGVTGNLVGRPLSDLKLGHSLVADVMFGARPGWGELEPAPEVVLSARLLPLLDGPGGSVAGLVVLLRDVTDLRRRDRLLLSKDATIREIHHRVKNNLQTISSLLRLQGRRMTEPSAKVAIEESARRIRSIAVVHEILSRDAGDDVAFLDVARPLVRMVEEGLVSSERPVRFELRGQPPTMASPTATAMAVVLTELLQNVVEHAVPDEPDAADPVHVVVQLGGDSRELDVTVTDDGRGLPDGFDPATAPSLGMSIVQALVTSELGGEIAFEPASPGAVRPGTRVTLRIPLAGPGAPPR